MWRLSPLTEWSLWRFAKGFSDFDKRECTIAEAHTASDESTEAGLQGRTKCEIQSNSCNNVVLDQLSNKQRSEISGSVQLINDAIHSLSLTNASNLEIVAVVAPFCNGYKLQTILFNSGQFVDRRQEGFYKMNKMLQFNGNHQIYEDIMFFTLSKRIGHASSRLGERLGIVTLASSWTFGNIACTKLKTLLACYKRHIEFTKGTPSNMLLEGSWDATKAFETNWIDKFSNWNRLWLSNWKTTEVVCNKLHFILFGIDILMDDTREVVMYPKGHRILSLNIGLVIDEDLWAAEEVSKFGHQATLFCLK
ncbi:hypothetical protein SUGI_1037890 [Cryptomeria japonica]|nr:hypothetical protein SUGI_1037890 [Cryptomeria japonica]